jgi:hypothetical protein
MLESHDNNVTGDGGRVCEFKDNGSKQQILVMPRYEGRLHIMNQNLVATKPR